MQLCAELSDEENLQLTFVLAFDFFSQMEELQNKLVEAETDKSVSLDQLQQKEREIQKLVSEKIVFFNLCNTWESYCQLC